MKIKFSIDYEAHREVIDKIFSGLTLENNGDKEQISDIVNKLERMLDFESLDVEHRLFIEYLTRTREISIFREEYKMSISKDKLMSSLEYNLSSFITKNKGYISSYILSNNYMQTVNLEVPTVFNEVINIVFTVMNDYYDLLINLGKSKSDSIDYIEILEEGLSREYYKKRVVTHAEILGEGFELGRDLLEGVEGVQTFDEYFNRLMDYKFKDDKTTKFHQITNVTELKESENRDVEHKKLIEFDIPPYKDKVAVYSNEFWNIVGTRGLGKTHFTFNVITDILMSGEHVICMFGESSERKLRQSIVSNYIDKKYGKRINYRDLMEEDTPESVKSFFKQKEEEFWNNKEFGKLFFNKYITYETSKQEIIDIHESIREKTGKAPMLLAVDHVRDLKCNGALTEKGYLRTVKERIDYFLDQIKELKEYFPMSYWILSHPSSKAKKMIQKGYTPKVDVMGNSSNGDTDADVQVVLRDNEDLKEMDKFIMGFSKAREVEGNLPDVILRKQFVTSRYIYKEDDQRLLLSIDEFNEDF